MSGVGRGFLTRHKGRGRNPQGRDAHVAGNGGFAFDAEGDFSQRSACDGWRVPQVKLSAVDFEGNWRIQREITDMRILESGTLEGEAHFTAKENGLLYHERGMLRFAGGAPVLAERSYQWSFQDDEVFVAYADGTPFHCFARVGAPVATPHLCGEDMYRGLYSFVRFPQWQVTWTVKGPRKNYRSVTQYTPEC